MPPVTAPDEETVSLPPVDGPKYPPTEHPEANGADTAPVSNAEAEWRKMLEPYLSKTPAPAPVPAATPVPRPVLAPLTDGTTVRVGILLPLTGPSAAVGNDMLQAAQMALFDFADADFELLPHDTAGQPEEASFAATMAIGDGARLMIGPLLSRSTHAIGPISRASGVPVIAFSSDSSVAGDGIYTLGFLPRNDVERVTVYALEQGLRNFAALAPDDPYGRAVVQSLQGTLGRYGGSLVETAFYDRNGSNMESVVKRLADYDNRREALLQERGLLEGRKDELSLKALERLELFETLGDLPYDALFIADGGDRLLQVSALLPFYDIDPRKVQILGTGQWDVTGMGAEPALLGSWFAAPPPEARARFQRRYEQIYGSTPHRLATLAYDATALAAVLARSGNPYPYAPESMMQASGFSGRDGVFRFAPDGTADRALAVLEIRQRDTITIDPASTEFSTLTH